MTTHAIKHFDTLGYVDRSKALGLDENLAKYQARQMEELLGMATDNARSTIEAAVGLFPSSESPPAFFSITLSAFFCSSIFLNLLTSL